MGLLGSVGCGVHRLLAYKTDMPVLPADDAGIAVCIRMAGIHILKIDVDATRAQASKQQAKFLALSRSLSY